MGEGGQGEGFRRAERAAIALLAVGISGFHLYTAAFGTLETLLQRVVHLASLLALTFLIKPLLPGRPGLLARLPDYALAGLSLAMGAYVFLDHGRLSTRAPWMDAVLPADIFFAVLTTLFLLEAARRIVGGVMTVVVAGFLAYVFLGPVLPGLLQHDRAGFLEFVDTLFLTTEGIFGIPVAASATYVFLFVLFGAFLEATKVGEFIIDFAVALVGRARGGPAKVAVVASACFGTVSGASVANVYGTGIFTIPLMKRIGYKPHFAGAVEAAASTGGQLMPPVMGSAAFIIAETLNIDYLQVCVAAIIPSVLYFYSIGLATHLEAARGGLPGIGEAEVRRARQSLLRRLHLFLPPAILVALLVLKFSPYYAALWSIVGTVLVSYARRETALGLRGFLAAMEAGARSGAMIAVATGAAGIIVGAIAHTGLGFKFMTLVLGLAKGHLFLALFFTMVAATILGMGVPTTPAYIIVSVIAAPSLIELHIEPLVAHMYVFMFAILSAVTPPVAVAGYAGANIAGADAMRTSFTAWKLSLIGFVIPYMAVYNPSLLAQGDLAVILRVSVTALAGVTVLGCGMYGWFLGPLSLPVRACFILGGLGMVDPNVWTDLLGLAVLGAGAAWHLARRRDASRKP